MNSTGKFDTFKQSLVSNKNSQVKSVEDIQASQTSFKNNINAVDTNTQQKGSTAYQYSYYNSHSASKSQV